MKTIFAVLALAVAASAAPLTLISPLNYNAVVRQLTHTGIAPLTYTGATSPVVSPITYTAGTSPVVSPITYTAGTSPVFTSNVVSPITRNLLTPITYSVAPKVVTTNVVQPGYFAQNPGATHVAPLPEGLAYASHHINNEQA